MNFDQDPPPDNEDSPAPPPADLETLLQRQARQLNEIFEKYHERAVIGSFSENRILVALRAQAQYQSTARTLRQWQRQRDGQDGDTP